MGADEVLTDPRRAVQSDQLRSSAIAITETGA
jgi:hypothetical protein